MVSDKAFNTNGTQTIFSSDFPVISEDHLRVFLDDVIVSRDEYDLINNAAVFFEAPAEGQGLVVQVGTTPGEVLSAPTDIGVVSTHIVEVQTVANNIGDVNALGDLIHSTNEYTVASVAPTSPTPGDRWFDTTTDTMKHYNSTAWIDTGLDSVKLGEITATGAEINHTTGVTGGIQDQLDDKAYFTGGSNTIFRVGTPTNADHATRKDYVDTAISSSPIITSPIITSPTINTSVSGSAISNDYDMDDASATTLATSLAVKAYVQQYQPGFVQTIVQPHTTAQTITSTGIDITGFDATITPKNSGSKIRIDIRWFGEVDEPWNVMFKLTRTRTGTGGSTTTTINLPSASGGSRNQGLCSPSQSYIADQNSNTPETAVFFTVDTPVSTGGTVTYQLRASSIANRTMWTGRTFVDTDSSGYERATGVIILTEIL